MTLAETTTEHSRKVPELKASPTLGIGNAKKQDIRRGTNTVSALMNDCLLQTLINRKI